MSGLVRRGLPAIAALTLAGLLSSCGGSDAPPSGSVSLSAPSCTISAGLGQCALTVQYSTDATSGVELRDTRGQVLASGPGGTATVAVLVGANTVSLTVHGFTIATASATGVCGTGSKADGATCLAPVNPQIYAIRPVLYGELTGISYGFEGGSPSRCQASSNWIPDPTGPAFGVWRGSGSTFGRAVAPIYDTTAYTWTCSNVNGTVTATSIVTPCAFGQHVEGATVGIGVCTWPDRSAQRVTYMLLGPDGYPARVTRAGVVPVPMRTRAGPDLGRVTRCEMATASGVAEPPVFRCLDPQGSRRYYFTNPNVEGLVEYDRDPWSGADWDAGAPDRVPLEAGAPGGTYFTRADSPLVLRWREAGTGAESVVATLPASTPPWAMRTFQAMYSPP